MHELELMDFVMEVQDVFGSCAVLDTIAPEDIPSFAKFTKIVWNYNKMIRVKNAN